MSFETLQKIEEIIKLIAPTKNRIQNNEMHSAEISETYHALTAKVSHTINASVMRNNKSKQRLTILQINSEKCKSKIAKSQKNLNEIKSKEKGLNSSINDLQTQNQSFIRLLSQILDKEMERTQMISNQNKSLNRFKNALKTHGNEQKSLVLFVSNNNIFILYNFL